MPITEVMNHPLVADIAENRESVHMQYTMDGCQDVQCIVYEDKSVSNSRAFFTLKPPLGSIIDRQILFELTVDVSMTGPRGDHRAFGEHFCPKALPANRAIDTCQISINSQAVMSEPGRIVEVMTRNKMNQESIKKFRSLSPSEPDAFNRYENYALGPVYRALTPNVAALPAAIGQLTGTAAVAATADLPGAIAARPVTITGYGGVDLNEFYSPFRNAPYCAGDDYEPRASFPYTESTVVGAVNATVTRRYVFTEVLLNPFCMIREGKAAAHVTSLDIQLQFGSNLDRIFSQIRAITYRNYAGGDHDATWAGFGPDHEDVTQGHGFAINISKARILVKSATPSVSISPKQELSLNHFRLNTQSLGQSANWGANGIINDSFNAVRLSVIPSHVFIYARPKVNTLRPYNADAFLAFTKLSLQISNRTGLLSSMTPQQLYSMSAENGVNMSWPQWSQKVGSVICLGFGKDIPGLLPGVREYIDFSFNFTAQNTTYFDHSGKTTAEVINWGAENPYNSHNLSHDVADQSLDWELCVLFVTPSTMTIEDQTAQMEQGIMMDDVRDAIQYGPSSETIEDMNQIVGAGFGDWIKRGYHKAHHFVKKYARPVEQELRKLEGIPGVGAYAGPAAGVADYLAKSVGTGMKHRLQDVRGQGKMY